MTPQCFLHGRFGRFNALLCKIMQHTQNLSTHCKPIQHCLNAGPSNSPTAGRIPNLLIHFQNLSFLKRCLCWSKEAIMCPKHPFVFNKLNKDLRNTRLCKQCWKSQCFQYPTQNEPVSLTRKTFFPTPIDRYGAHGSQIDTWHCNKEKESTCEYASQNTIHQYFSQRFIYFY